MSYEKTIEDLQNWLGGKYVSPPVFKDSLTKALYYLELLDSAVDEDDKTKTRLLGIIERYEKAFKEIQKAYESNDENDLDEVLYGFFTNEIYDDSY